MAQAAQQSYLRPNQLQEMENEKRVLENTLKQRDVQERGQLINQIARMETQITKHAPPDLTPTQRDQAVRECRMVEERLTPLMPSDEEMRRNPPGTVGRHMRFDKQAKARDRFPEGELRRWKNNQLALNKGDDDPDVANFERMRPLHNHQASMLNAQIPGRTFVGTNPSPAYLEGYDRVFGASEGDGVLEPSGLDLEDESGLGNLTTAIAAEESPGIEEHEPVAKPVKRKAPTRGKRGTYKASPKMAAHCGKVVSTRGLDMHVRACAECKAASKPNGKRAKARG